MSARKIVREDYPDANAIKNINADKDKTWSIVASNKQIAFGSTENIAWMNAKNYVKNQFKRKIYAMYL